MSEFTLLDLKNSDTEFKGCLQWNSIEIGENGFIRLFYRPKSDGDGSKHGYDFCVLYIIGRVPVPLGVTVSPSDDWWKDACNHY